MRAVTLRMALVVALMSGAACESDEPDLGLGSHTSRPNILIILTDDQTLRGTMQVMDATRRIFGEGGVRFRNAVVTTPVCCPSRASIFSGRYVHNHNVIGNHSARRLDQDQTMQSELQRAGYTTALAGKFLNFWTEAPPNFDRWAIFDRGYGSTRFNVDGRIESSEYSTTFVRDYSLELLRELEEDDDRPWMLQISPYAPHFTKPRHKHEMVQDRYRNAKVGGIPRTPSLVGRSEKPAFLHPAQSDLRLEDRRFRRHLRALLSVDDLVQDVFSLLARLDETEDTLAFFLSDNGYLLGQHGLSGKSLPYEDSVRVPFYVRWPGVLADGSTDRRIVANIDIAPTAYAAAGVTPSYPVDGQDIRTSDRNAILLENQSLPVKERLRWIARWTPRTLFVEWSKPTFDEYYGRDDPWQLDNLAGDPANPRLSRRLTRLKAWLDGAADCVGGECP